MRQDVAVRVCVHKNTVSLLSLTLPGCHQAASHRPAERRCTWWSGRRGSNPRQPAWKADRRENTARLLWSGPRGAFTNHARHPSVIEADGRAIWKADGYLLSLPSYPLHFGKTRLIGNMFYLTMVPSKHCIHVWDEHVRKDEETLPEALRALRYGAHVIQTVPSCESAWCARPRNRSHSATSLVTTGSSRTHTKRIFS